MSLILEHSDNVDIGTNNPIISDELRLRIGDIWIHEKDIVPMIMYIIKNTDLKPEGDFRIELMSRLASLSMTEGYNKGAFRMVENE